MALLLTLFLMQAQPSVAATPKASAGHNLLYARALGGVILLNGEADPARIWLWNGTGWKDLGELGTTPRSLAAAAYDVERKQVLVHGGALPNKQGDGSIDWKVDGRTLAWDGKAWKTVAETGPSPRDHHAMAYDSDRERIVLFGGGDADPSGRSEFFGDTWEWDGKAWSQLPATGPGPGPKVHHAMAYDPLRKRTVLVGGYGSSGPDGITWEWDGTSWKNAGQSAVAYRASPRIAFDGNRGKVVLFGGDSKSDFPSDTYAWDGSQWTRIAEQGPPGRSVHALAFDEARKVLVLFGGRAPNSLGDTWEFGPEGWKQVTAPRPR